MSEPRFAALAAEVEGELRELAALLPEADRLRPRLTADPDPLDLRAAGSILHDFYSGLERLFERVANEIDGGVPVGPDWHVSLLHRMALPIAAVRPAAISQETSGKLDDYVRFRHVFRNVYGRQLRWGRMGPLFDELPSVFEQLTAELRQFVIWLRLLSSQT